MPTPQFNVRVPEQFHGLLRDIVEGLRANPGLAGALSAVCRQAKASPGADIVLTVVDISRLEAMEARLEAVEAWLTNGGTRSVPPARRRSSEAALPAADNRVIPDEILAEAAALWDGGRGASFDKIIKAKGWTCHRSALHKAVVRYLARQPA